MNSVKMEEIHNEFSFLLVLIWLTEWSRLQYIGHVQMGEEKKTNLNGESDHLKDHTEMEVYF